MALAQKYRPTTLDEIAGNEDTVNALNAVLHKPKEDIPHAILLVGQPGCGKTTLGRITANMLGCSESDYHEVDTTVYRKTNDIEDILHQVNLAPWNGDVSVWLLDEAHQIGVGGDSPTNKAQNALLKILEEPPKHVYFILCTTNPEMLLSTIRSRCTLFEVQPLGPSIMESFLKTISRSERKRVPPEVLQQIAQDSLGSCRNALQILDKVIDLDPDDMLRVAEQAAAKENQVIDLCRAVIENRKWNEVAKILKGLEKEKPESVRLAVLGYCANVLLSGKDVAQAFIVMDCLRDPLYVNGKAGLVLSIYEALEGIKAK